MATRTVATAAAAPTQVTGLAAGTTYIAQNVSRWPVQVFAVSGTDAPDLATAPSFRADPGQSITLLPVTGESIWVWSPNGTARVVYDQVP